MLGTSTAGQEVGIQEDAQATYRPRRGEPEAERKECSWECEEKR